MPEESSTQELINLLKKEKIWLQKKFGQNFLVNQEVLKKIITAAELTKTDEVVEVGPGLGVLTAKLCEYAQKVTTIEIDKELIPLLQKNLQKFSNLTIKNQDALQFLQPETDYKLVANIPYYITSPLLRHFLNPENPERKRPNLIVLLVQKEVAEKVCAPTGEHSVLSLEVQIFGKPKIISMVDKSSFFPQPKVDSAILKIETYEKPLITNLELFFKLIKSTFSQRRKTLLNSLGHGFPLSREERSAILKKAEIAENQRPQGLKIEEWERLMKELNHSKHSAPGSLSLLHLQ